MNTTDDNDRPTAWEDINPPMASAPRPAPLSTFSARRLQPASRDDFRNELTACLALVVPAGMDEAARREWLAVAYATVGHLPPDLLKLGCEKARQTADHPSKIVPSILAETEDLLAQRRNVARCEPLALEGQPKKLSTNSLLDRRGHPMSDEDTAELNSILEGLGATARYRADGSRYVVETQ